jgi:hypothetical protein
MKKHLNNAAGHPETLKWMSHEIKCMYGKELFGIKDNKDMQNSLQGHQGQIDACPAAR